MATAVETIQARKGSAAQDRRQLALLSALGVLDFIPISLYQLGIIRHLPDPPGRLFHSDAINASRDAQIAGLPDGPISLLLYASNLLLSGAALKANRRRNRFDYLMSAVAVGQAAGGAYYLYTMLRVHKKICPYCVTGALLNFAALLPLSRLLRRNG